MAAQRPCRSQGQVGTVHSSVATSDESPARHGASPKYRVVQPHRRRHRSHSGQSPARGKAGLVFVAIRRQSGEFRLADIERACPGVGREWIRSLLTDLKAAGEAICRGKGPAARWRYFWE